MKLIRELLTETVSQKVYGLMISQQGAEDLDELLLFSTKQKRLEYLIELAIEDIEDTAEDAEVDGAIARARTAKTEQALLTIAQKFNVIWADDVRLQEFKVDIK